MIARAPGPSVDEEDRDQSQKAQSTVGRTIDDDAHREADEAGMQDGQ